MQVFGGGGGGGVEGVGLACVPRFLSLPGGLAAAFDLGLAGTRFTAFAAAAFCGDWWCTGRRAQGAGHIRETLRT